MLDAAKVDDEIAAYDEKLLALSERFQQGARSRLVHLAQMCGDELVCLLEEAPLSRRNRIDHLIDRFEALRISCMS